LYIAREITQAHGGTIQATSRNHPGTTFTVLLPRAYGESTNRPPHLRLDDKPVPFDEEIAKLSITVHIRHLHDIPHSYCLSDTVEFAIRNFLFFRLNRLHGLSQG
jgi:hypothetical protein